MGIDYLSKRGNGIFSSENRFYDGNGFEIKSDGHESSYGSSNDDPKKEEPEPISSIPSNIQENIANTTFLSDLKAMKKKWLQHKTGRNDIVDMNTNGWTTDKGDILSEDDGLPPPYDNDVSMLVAFDLVRDAINEME